MRQPFIACSPLLTLLLAVSGSAADTAIYRCLLDDGTFAFQETPCPEPDQSNDEREALSADDDAVDFVNPFDEAADAPTPTGAPLPERLSRDRAACEQETRDAIDTIDREMRETAYSAEQGEQYLADLLELTRQLRACKGL